MKKKLYLGVDVGTYETKGVLVDSKGVVHNSAAIKHEMIIPKPGWAEHSPQDVWWGDFVLITKKLLNKKNISSNQIYKTLDVVKKIEFLLCDKIKITLKKKTSKDKISNISLSNKKLISMLNIKFTMFDKGLKKTINSYLN